MGSTHHSREDVADQKWDALAETLGEARPCLSDSSLPFPAHGDVPWILFVGGSPGNDSLKKHVWLICSLEFMLCFLCREFFFFFPWDIKRTDLGKEAAFLSFFSVSECWSEVLKMFCYTVVWLASVQAAKVAATHSTTWGWDAKVKAVLLQGCSESQTLSPCLCRKDSLLKSSPCQLHQLQDLSPVRSQWC